MCWSLTLYFSVLWRQCCQSEKFLKSIFGIDLCGYVFFPSSLCVNFTFSRVSSLSFRLFSTLFINNVHLSVTTEWRGPPVEQHSMSSAHGGVSRQCGAETFLSIYARTYVVATKSPERSRIYQDVTRTECIGCHDGAGLFCKTHYRGQKSWMTWQWSPPPHIFPVNSKFTYLFLDSRNKDQPRVCEEIHNLR